MNNIFYKSKVSYLIIVLFIVSCSKQSSFDPLDGNSSQSIFSQFEELDPSIEYADLGDTEIDFVLVADIGNAPDQLAIDRGRIGPVVFDTKEGMKGTLGRVDYTYLIGKYELTRRQYLDFLNKVDPYGEDKLKLNSSFDFRIVKSNPPGQRYQVDDRKHTAHVNSRSYTINNSLEIPVEITFYQAMRFCNWLHHGKKGPGSTEGTDKLGAYDTRFLNDLSGIPEKRNSRAKFWIPNESEWHKAAYYKRGGRNAGYWKHPNRSDPEPRGELSPGGNNSGNFIHKDNNIGNAEGRKIPVGSYPNSYSPYGLFDLGGNLMEWTESKVYLLIDNWSGKRQLETPMRRERGGHFAWFPDHSGHYYRGTDHNRIPEVPRGLRVAARPEFQIQIGVVKDYN